MIVVTGAAGFIGSNLVRALNERGRDDVLAVDNLSDGKKIFNLADCEICDYLDKGRFIEAIAAGDFDTKIEAIFHQGACTDTAATDRHAVMDNNCTFSQELMRCALTAAVPFVYASSAAVYGAGSEAFTEDPTCERPINLYAQSKLAFDQHVRREIPQAQSTLVGLRYFNVYGPRESRKGKMAAHEIESAYMRRIDRLSGVEEFLTLHRSPPHFEDADQRWLV
ncbi:MAG: NAD-dependent epimerase/dehydratase family protein, partial [Proteobacteria bacterium]|nr:NAD-dependent epimerase/dehydratase family protein [Pseudomonadota bacterium]